MLKYCKQPSERSKPSHDRHDLSDSHKGNSFDNSAFSNDEVSSFCDAKDFDIHSGPTSSLPLATNSILTKGLSSKNNSILQKIQEEDEDQISDGEQSHKKAINFAVILTVTVLGICFAVGHYYIGYYPEEKGLNYGDSFIIDYSSYFCSAVTSNSDDVWLSAASNIDYTGHLRYTMQALLYLEVGQIWSRMFHLNKRSMVSINISSNDIIFVLIFKGRRNYDLWIERKAILSYEMKQACCVNGRQPDRIEFTANESEDFIFVLYRDISFGSAVHFNFTFEFIRPQIDSTQIKRQCKTSITTKCSITLTFGSSEKAIIEVQNGIPSRGITSERNVTWKCDARIWFYCVVYGFLIIFLSTLLILCNDTRKYWKTKYSKTLHEGGSFQMKARESEGTNTHTNVIENNTIVTNAMKIHSLSSKSCYSMASHESSEKYQNWTVDYDTCDKESLKVTGYENNTSIDSRNNKGIDFKSDKGEIATIFRNESETNQKSSSVPLVKYIARKFQSQGESDEIRSSELEPSSISQVDSEKIIFELKRERELTEELKSDYSNEKSTKKIQHNPQDANESRKKAESKKRTPDTNISQIMASASSTSSNTLSRNTKLKGPATKTRPKEPSGGLPVGHLDQESQRRNFYTPHPINSNDTEKILIGEPINV